MDPREVDLYQRIVWVSLASGRFIWLESKSTPLHLANAKCQMPNALGEFINLSSRSWATRVVLDHVPSRPIIP